ncbi:hypothetical protein Tco_1545854 [Tanacetum coccineum]
MIVNSEIIYDFPRFFSVLVAELTASSAVSLTLKMNRDMIIENLDLEPKINAMARNFLESPSWWKELSKETGSKILASGDGSYKKTVKLIASLIAKDIRMRDMEKATRLMIIVKETQLRTWEKVEFLTKLMGSSMQQKQTLTCIRKLYTTPNEAFKILKDKVLLKLDFSDKSQINPKPKTIFSASGSSINSDHVILMEKLEALATKIDSEFLFIRKELKEMRDGRRDNHVSKFYMRDNTSMYDPMEANYVQGYHGGYPNQNRKDSCSYPINDKRH